jgi:hypothetical protein
MIIEKNNGFKFNEVDLSMSQLQSSRLYRN